MKFLTRHYDWGVLMISKVNGEASKTQVFQNPPVILGEDRCLELLKGFSSGDVFWGFVHTTDPHWV